MAFADNEFQPDGGAYTAAVVDAALVRQVLRLMRKRRFSSSRKAAKAAKLDPSTVAKLENLKTWPDYSPSMDVVLALLQAMDIQLSAFAAQVEAADERFDLIRHGGAEQSLESVAQPPTESANLSLQNRAEHPQNAGSATATGVEANHGASAVLSGGGGGGEPLGAILAELRALLSKSYQILATTDSISKAVAERFGGVAVAPAGEQDAITRVLQSPQPPPVRGRSRPHARKARR
jgi:transcriptional regulator with XRE-family HTH domain